MDRKIVAIAEVSGGYGAEQIRVEQFTRGKHAGRFVVRGFGRAGRISFTRGEVACETVRRQRNFVRWINEFETVSA